MATVGITFQPDLIGVMSQFSQFDAILKKHLATATESSASVIGSFQVEFMWSNFKEPTGALEDSVGVTMLTEYLAYIGPQPGEAASVYAWRRDRGFSGMTDSAGRFFPFDPGIYYAEESIQDDTTLSQVASFYINAVWDAWAECVGSVPSGTTAEVTNY